MPRHPALLLCVPWFAACVSDAEAPEAIGGPAAWPSLASIQCDTDGDGGRDDPAPGSAWSNNANHPDCDGTGNCLVAVDITDPAAVCNDGTPGRIYVHAAPPGSPHADDWIVHLDGGGSCGSAEDCLDRWCGAQGIYDASKMSAVPARRQFEGRGIFSGSVANPFADWNQVFVYYCSSDGWLGALADKRLTATVAIAPSTSVPYRIQFAGYAIVNAAFELLRAQGAGNHLPDLDDADRVLFTGSSAGAGGVRHHVDRIAAALRIANPDVDVRAVVDSGPKPFEDYLAGRVDSPRDDVEPPFATLAEFELDEAAKNQFAGAVVDDSCAAMHPTDGYRCHHADHTLMHHVTTPLFVRAALREKMPDRDDDGELDVSPKLWAEATRRLLGSFADLATTAEEGAHITVTPGGFGPDCTSHTSLDSARFEGELVVFPAPRTPRAERTVLSDWLDGTGPGLVIQDPGLASTCP